MLIYVLGSVSSYTLCSGIVVWYSLLCVQIPCVDGTIDLRRRSTGVFLKHPKDPGFIWDEPQNHQGFSVSQYSPGKNWGFRLKYSPHRQGMNYIFIVITYLLH